MSSKTRIKLTQAEIDKINCLTDDSFADSRIKTRAKVLQMLNEGKYIKEISNVTGLCEPTISSIGRKYEKEGIDSIFPKNRIFLTEEERKHLSDLSMDKSISKTMYNRVMVLLLNDRGKSCIAISDILGINIESVKRYCRLCRSEGVGAVLSLRDNQGCRYISVSPDDREILQSGIDISDSEIRRIGIRRAGIRERHAKVILASENCRTIKEIMEKTGYGTNTVRKSLKEYREGGTAAILAIRSINRNKSEKPLGADDISYIKETVKNGPACGFWTVNSLLETIHKNAENDGYPEMSSMTSSTLYSILKRFNIDIRKTVIDEETLQYLRDIASHSNMKGNYAKVVKRANILLFRFDGMTQKEISEKLNISMQTVSRCIRKYEAEGIEQVLFDNLGSGNPHQKPKFDRYTN